MLNLQLVRLRWAVLISYGLLAAPLAHAASPPEPLDIVVTIPVLKDLTEQVGGPHVRVTSLLSGCCSKSVSALKSGSPRW